MSTNNYFRKYNSFNEQNLYESLVIEQIKIYGIDVYYIPRTIVNQDILLREADTISYNSFYGIEMYPKNLDSFGGDGKFLSKFNLEIRDEITFIVSQRVYKDLIGNQINNTRPYEGDLIYFPFNNKLFTITYVNHEALFYPFGKLFVYELSCQLFEYANETFNTGIDFIDNKYNAYSTDIFSYFILDTAGNIITDFFGNSLVQVEYSLVNLNPAAQNENIEELANDVIDIQIYNPWNEISTE